MSWAALTSGGKDSILSVQKAIDSGKNVRYLVTARPENRDSYMFHSANLDAVAAIEFWGKRRLFVAPSRR